jgi:hypothetical protein
VVVLIWPLELVLPFDKLELLEPDELDLLELDFLGAAAEVRPAKATTNRMTNVRNTLERLAFTFIFLFCSLAFANCFSIPYA